MINEDKAVNHILFFTRICPFPPYGGEKIRSIELIKLLSKVAQRVSVLMPQRPDSAAYHFDENIHFVLIPEKERNKLETIVHNRTSIFIKEPALLKKIEEIHAQNRIQIAVIDYGFLGQYISFFKRLGIPKVIYGTHNAQSALTLQHKKASIFGNLDQFIKFCLQNIHERKYFKLSDHLLCVSEEDAAFHASLIDPFKIMVLPNFIDEDVYDFGPLPKSQRKKTFIMTANFLSFQNSEGAKWFIREVWDQSLSNEYQLLLIGLGSKEFLKNFSDKDFEPQNCQAKGEISDLKPLLAESICAVVPLLHGSGSRLKVLEAMALGTPLVSTNVGAEGIEHNGYIHTADQAVTFRRQMHEVVQLNEEQYSMLCTSLKTAYLNKYSHQANLKLFKNLIQKDEKAKLKASS
ncbi:MAG: glycosyltransferase family 4 protein [Cyclobacteriaceae bacterium]